MALKRVRCGSLSPLGRGEQWSIERRQPPRQASPEYKSDLSASATQVSKRSRIYATCVGAWDSSPTRDCTPSPQPSRRLCPPEGRGSRPRMPTGQRLTRRKNTGAGTSGRTARGSLKGTPAKASMLLLRPPVLGHGGISHSARIAPANGCAEGSGTADAIRGEGFAAIVGAEGSDGISGCVANCTTAGRAPQHL